MFVFDPTQHPKIREACAGKTLDPQVREDLVSFRQDHILSEATRRIRSELGLRQDQRDKRPLIVVLTQYDAWSSLVGSRTLQEDWVLQQTESSTGAMHLTEAVWGVRMRFLGNSAVFFAFDGSDNDATSESGRDLCG
jgi:hypothetical protein